MSRWIPGLLLAGIWTLAAQQQSTPPASPAKPELEQRTPPKTSGKQEVPPEEDASFLKEEVSFNPLQSEKSVKVGDEYLKKGKVQAAANRYQYATMWNDGNAEAWLKLGKANEKLKKAQAAKDAYTKYLAVAPDSKEAPAVRKKLASLK